MQQIGRLNIPPEWSQSFEDRMIALSDGPFYKRADWLAADLVVYLTFGPNECIWFVPGTQRD